MSPLETTRRRRLIWRERSCLSLKTARPRSSPRGFKRKSIVCSLSSLTKLQLTISARETSLERWSIMTSASSYPPLAQRESHWTQQPFMSIRSLVCFLQRSMIALSQNAMIPSDLSEITGTDSRRNRRLKKRRDFITWRSVSQFAVVTPWPS